MKTKSILAGLVVMLSTAFATKAQSIESTVKILPAAEKGMLKVLYAQKSRSAVRVKFLNEDGLIRYDRIKASTFQNGFSKKYDVSHIKDKAFWVEITSEDLSIRYRMVAKDGAYIPHLEYTAYNPQTVASIN